MKIKKLHPTLKACACGFIGTSTQLYHHFEYARSDNARRGLLERAFYEDHGEVPLNEDDIRVVRREAYLDHYHLNT